MPIKLNGATSGSVELDVPAAVGSDLQLTLPTTAGTLDRLERAGNILQVVQGSSTTAVNIATTVYTDSGLSASITPTSSTSKVLVSISQQVQIYRDDAAQGVGIKILRDSTTIYEPSIAGLGEYISAGGTGSINIYTTVNRHVLDSPNTTNSVTYKTMGRPYITANSGKVQFQLPGISYITLMEVAA
tara:strand:- start:476 stop:1036 length:561 start_codon:yes stop_codon:yes gene_type:complete